MGYISPNGILRESLVSTDIHQAGLTSPNLDIFFPAVQVSFPFISRRNLIQTSRNVSLYFESNQREL